MNDDDKKVLGEMIHTNVERTTRKNYLLVALAMIAIAVVVGMYPIVLINFGVVKLQDYDYIESEFFINDLKSENFESLSSWFLVTDDKLRINIVNADEYTGKDSLVKKVILSDEVMLKDTNLQTTALTKTYYVGWKKALETAATKETARYIPQNFEIITSKQGEGDITITLSSLENGDGKLGSTKVLVDKNRNEILKVHITIYQVDEISDQTFEAVIRHEIGHALGLPHSASPTDLMHDSFSVENAYISECDIDGIVTLYSEESLHPFVCED